MKYMERGERKMAQFHETVAGQRFLNKQVPMLIAELGRLANAVEKHNELIEKENKDDKRRA